MTSRENTRVSTLNAYRTLPNGCVAHLVTDKYSEPFIHAGEWVVVDTKDKAARHGDVYVIEFMGGRRRVVEARIMDQRGEDGSQIWSVGSLFKIGTGKALEWINRVQSNTSGAVPEFPGGWSDTGYPQGYLESKLVGAVIGLYLPEFEEPKRPGDIAQIAAQLKEAVQRATGETCRIHIDLPAGVVLVRKI